MNCHGRFSHGAAAAAFGALLQLAACAGGPPPSEWKTNARSALDRAVAADLAGNTRIAETEFGLARRELARTGRADQVALAELTRCAVRVAAVEFGPCLGFESLRVDADPVQRAYADYLAGRVAPADVALLPEPHRAIGASGDASAATLKTIEDPLSRLVAIGVLFQRGRASPEAIALAVDTASVQGWRRPLLAWLGVQLELAEKAGDSAAAERVRRRIALAGG